jgi:hypothetical protein
MFVTHLSPKFQVNSFVFMAVNPLKQKVHLININKFSSYLKDKKKTQFHNKINSLKLFRKVVTVYA